MPHDCAPAGIAAAHSRSLRSWFVALGLIGLVAGRVLASDLPASRVRAVPTVFRFSTAVDRGSWQLLRGDASQIRLVGAAAGLARQHWVAAEHDVPIDVQ